MPTRIPLTFSRHSTTKIPAVKGWVFVKPLRDDQFYVTASNRRAETVGERDVYYTVVDLVNSLGGPVPYMPANSTESSAEIIVNKLLEADDEDDFDVEADFKEFVSKNPEALRKEKLQIKILTGQNRYSQYVVKYLNDNEERGEGKGLTIGSFLAYNLRGLAKEYSLKYATALRNALSAYMYAGFAEEGYSKLGRDAYYWTSIEDINSIKQSLGLERYNLGIYRKAI